MPARTTSSPSLPARLLSARIKAGVRIANLSRKIERDHNTIREKNAELNRLNRRFMTASLTDPLTGLPNRRHAWPRRRVEGLRAQQDRSAIMLDIDRFKAVNDNHGHDVGDEVLQATSRITGALRGEDEAFRLGGRSSWSSAGTPGERRRLVAERIEGRWRGTSSPPGFEKAVTVSLGVAGARPASSR